MLSKWYNSIQVRHMSTKTSAPDAKYPEPRAVPAVSSYYKGKMNERKRTKLPLDA